MKDLVFVILWLGEPVVFRHYTDAVVWLKERVPYLNDVDVRHHIETINVL